MQDAQDTQDTPTLVELHAVSVPAGIADIAGIADEVADEAEQPAMALDIAELATVLLLAPNQQQIRRREIETRIANHELRARHLRVAARDIRESVEDLERTQDRLTDHFDALYAVSWSTYRAMSPILATRDWDRFTWLADRLPALAQEIAQWRAVQHQRQMEARGHAAAAALLLQVLVQIELE